MKNLSQLLFVAFLTTSLSVGCQPKDPKTTTDDHGHSANEGHDHGAGDGHGDEHAHADHDHESESQYGLEALNASQAFKAGSPTNVKFVVRDNKSGEVQKSFDVVHEEKLHMIVVDEALQSFQHVHPVMDAEGFWSQSLSLPYGGNFLVFADGSVGGKAFSAGAAKLKATGGAAPKANFALSAVSSAGGIKAEIEGGAKINMTEHADIKVKLYVMDGWENFLGAPGHFIMISQDGDSFAHAHPEGGMEKGVVTFGAHVHESGVYRAWAQFQRNGKVLTFPFTVEVTVAQ